MYGEDALAHARTRAGSHKHPRTQAHTHTHTRTHIYTQTRTHTHIHNAQTHKRKQCLFHTHNLTLGNKHTHNHAHKSSRSPQWQEPRQLFTVTSNYICKQAPQDRSSLCYSWQVKHTFMINQHRHRKTIVTNKNHPVNLTK